MSKPLTKTKTKRLHEKLNSQVNTDKEIVFLLQAVEDEVNVGAMFRIADGIGAKIVLCGKTPTPPNDRISMVARGLDRSVIWDYKQDITEAMEFLRENKFQILAVEATEGAIPYSEYSYSDKVALVLGNEARGVYKKILALCDDAVFIPMLGKGPSLNVHVAGAIVGYQAMTSKSLPKKNQ